MKKKQKKNVLPSAGSKQRFPWKISPRPYPATPRSKKNPFIKLIKRS